MYKFKMRKMGFSHVLEHYFTWKIIRKQLIYGFKKKTGQLTKAILKWIKILKVKVKFMFKVIKCRIWNFENLGFSHVYTTIFGWINEKYQLKKALLKWMKKYMSRSRSSNVEIQNAENLDFHMFWNNIWIGTWKIVIKKTSSLWNEINESVQESNSPIDEDIWIWRSRLSNVVVQNAEKNWDFHMFRKVFRKEHKRK